MARIQIVKNLAKMMWVPVAGGTPGIGAPTVLETRAGVVVVVVTVSDTVAPGTTPTAPYAP